MLASSAETPVYTIDELASHWNLTVAEINDFKKDPEFIRQARSEMLLLKKTSSHLQVKASLLLEMWLDHLAPTWLSDPNASVGDKDKVLNSILKVTGIMERNKAAEAMAIAAATSTVTSTPSLTVVFTSPNDRMERVIN
jgi:hypothetical protein